MPAEADLARPHLRGTLDSRLPYAVNPCLSCRGTCCHERVRVLLVEAVRMTAVLGLPIRSVVNAVPYEEAVDRAFRCVPLNLSGGPTLLTMRQTEGSEGHCVMVLKVGDRMLCGIYGLRPAVCRLFPYTVEADGEVLSVGGFRHCPVRWTYVAETLTHLRHSVDALRADLELEDRVVAAWEASGPTERSLEALVDHARPAVLAAAGVDPRQVAGPSIPATVKLGRPLW